MKVNPDCRYTETHEWVRVEGDEAEIGITDYAQDQLSDIVFVEMPFVGDVFEKGEEFAVVESVKAASECYMPIGGEVIEINGELEDAPQLVNEDPYGAGWFIRISVNNPDELGDLMIPDEYKEHVAAEMEKGGH